MHLGYNTWSMPTLGIDQTVQHLARLGFDSMELTVCPGWATDAVLLDGSERRRIKALIADLGLRLSGCTGNTSVIVDEAAWTINRNLLFGYLDLAAELRADKAPIYVSTTSGVAPGRDPASLWDIHKNAIVDRFGVLAAYATSRGVFMHLEPHVHTAVRQPQQALWVIDQVGSPSFRISLDTSHFEVQGMNIGEVIAMLAPIAGGVEVKDGTGIYPNFDWLIPGEGDTDYVGILTALSAAGYKGSVSVEISKLRQDLPDYEPLRAAEMSYRVLAAAFVQAGVSRS